MAELVSLDRLSTSASQTGASAAGLPEMDGFAKWDQHHRRRDGKEEVRKNFAAYFSIAGLSSRSLIYLPFQHIRQVSICPWISQRPERPSVKSDVKVLSQFVIAEASTMSARGSGIRVDSFNSHFAGYSSEQLSG